MSMKFLNSLVVFTAVIFMASCNNEEVTTNATTSTKLETSKAVNLDAAEPAEPEMATTVTAETAKVVYLKTDMFINQIFDYKANPQAWVYKGDKPAIIDFYTDWCGPCKRVAPIMEELAAEYAGQVNIYKMNTEKEREVAGIFGIRSIPSILYIPVNGQPTMYTGAFGKQRYVDLINEKLITK